jgi:hypothetical protein
MTTRLALVVVACAVACSHPAPQPPIIEVGDSDRAQLAIELEPQPIEDEPASTNCVAGLVQTARQYPQQPDAVVFDGNPDDVRKRLNAIHEDLKRSGSSVDHMPDAYLHAAERFAEYETNLAGAALFFRDALNYPPDENRLYFYAALRLAQVEQLSGAHESALADFPRVTAGESRYPDALCMTELAARAREGIVVSYARVGQPSKAFPFFQRVSGDANGTSTRTLGMMVRLVDLFAIRGSDDAYSVMRDLITRPTDRESCDALRVVVRDRYFLRTKLAADLTSRCIPR